MTGEADDLLLSLMQIADEAPAPEPVSKGSNLLGSLKPYHHHKGECMGMVHTAFGTDEDEDIVFRFVCAKCGKEEIVSAARVQDELVVKSPDWVAAPNV